MPHPPLRGHLSALPALLAAALADRYRLEQELGKGGMATVYLAHDLRHDRKVALKVLRPEFAAVIGADRFLREIGFAARLTHPHIVPLHDSGQAAGLLYYVMPFIDGETLRQRLTRRRRLPLEEALPIALEVADALAYSHAHGIVHRDIKPENILLQGGHAMVADFGIARAIEVPTGEGLTDAGTRVGTVAYMSPEQAMGVELDGRSDIYSLGCVLYEMLTGDAPHTAATPGALIAGKLTQAPPRVPLARLKVPAAIQRAVLRALEADAAQRFPTANEFAAALRAGARARPAIPASAGHRRRHGPDDHRARPGHPGSPPLARGLPIRRHAAVVRRARLDRRVLPGGRHDRLGARGLECRQSRYPGI